MEINLGFIPKEGGFFPVILIHRPKGEWERLFEIPSPLEISLKDHGKETGIYHGISIEGKEVIAEGKLLCGEGSVYGFADKWRLNGNVVHLNRHINVEKKGESEGFRSTLYLTSCFTNGVRFHDFQYFIPKIFYKYNDTEHRGIDDYLEAYNLSFREDGMTAPAVMGYYPSKNFYISLIRSSLPKYDNAPKRKRGERFFLQDTDIGSLGFKLEEELKPTQITFQAHYPYYEGEKSFGLNRKKESYGAFVPNKMARTIDISYQIRVQSAGSFLDSLWDLFSYLIAFYNPQPWLPPFSLSDAIDYRISCLSQCYHEWDQTIDQNEPVGFVTYLNTITGDVLSESLHIGFGGRQLLNAYCFMRYGYDKKDVTYVDKARKIIEFFVKTCQLKNGMLCSGYDVHRKSAIVTISARGIHYGFGFSLPQSSLPKNVKGVYLREMCEGAHALLLSYQTDKMHGVDHKNWLEFAIRYGNFLKEHQNPDGSWYRAYTLEGKDVVRPRQWFGRTREKRKSSTAYAIPFLVKLFEITQEKKYLDCAHKACDYILKKFVETDEYYGGTLDRANVIDEEAALSVMEACLSLYEIIRDDRFLEGAVRAGKVSATWNYIWDVPFPKTTHFGKLGFKTTGWSGVECLDPYVDNYSLFDVRDFLKLAEITRDEAFFTVATVVSMLYILHLGLSDLALRQSLWGVLNRLALRRAGFTTDMEFGHT